jgi:predicted exporter/peptidoglycan/xylan/chitin deacetylase (PgdA/CDA1 family)
MNRVAQRWAVGTWLVFVAACIAVITRTTFTTDISAFLPRSPTPEQRVLVEQLRDGVVSRLVLIGIEGGAPEALAQASRRLTAELRTHEDFVSIANGEDAELSKDREFLWRYRYLLSPAVTPERFSARGLRERLEEHLQMLGSSAGVLVRRMLPRDPSGELRELIEPLEGQGRPALRDGVWFSRDGSRALLLAQTRAAGYDIDAQERALAAIRGAFAHADGASGSKLLLTGPGVFSVSARAAIKGDALLFSLIASVLVAGLLFALFRSPRVVGLSLLPVASGAAAGVAAVSLGFGSVHGITLGFGVTLIGEGVDYAIYLFTQTAPGVAPHRALDRIWPTLRLGVLTSICGFSAMLFSGFTGLAQLGLFSITGLVVAVAITRWVLPALLPRGFAAPVVADFAPAAMAMARGAPRLRYPLLAVVTLAAALLAAQRGPLWSDDLASLSPVPRSDQLLDRQLRRDIGAPDVRHLVVIRAGDEETALQAAEAFAAALRNATRRGLLEGYDSPSAWLPSRAAQQARQAALPAPAVLRANLARALRGLPYRPGTFEPFLEDAAAAKKLPLIDRGALQGTGLALKVDTLLVKRGEGWAAMLPLRGVTDAAALAREIGAVAGAQAVLLDLKRESDQLYQSYRREALVYSLAGAAAIVALLFVTLRSPRRVYDVLAPLAAAVAVTTGLLALGGRTLSIFHLVGLLLVVAVGSNYSLFFDRQALAGADRSRTLVSLLFATVTTVVGFGLLSFSSVPVLSAIGSTVGLGAILALSFSAILGRRDTDSAGGSRTWRPAPAMELTLMLHAAGAVVLVLRPALWPWVLGAIAANHLLLLAAVLWPRGQALGPNLVRLPAPAAGRNEVCLTFDDGPHPDLTPRVLDLLDRYRAKASFFCVGAEAEACPHIVKEIARRGHSVENHSHRHPRAFAFYGPWRLKREVEAAQAAIAGITGRAPEFFRAPAGFRSPLLDPVLARSGLRYVSWTRRGFDTVDGDVERVAARLARGLAAGDVLLLHERAYRRTPGGEPVTLAILAALLERLAAAGLKSVSLPAACGRGPAT